MNNKIFIAASLLLTLAVSLIFGGMPELSPVPDSVVMSDSALPPLPVPTEDEILAEITDILSLWQDGGTSPEMAIIQLEKWSGNEDKDISKAALDGIFRITVETDGKMLFADAKADYASGRYIDAIRNIINIDPSCSLWSECSALLVSCKQAVNKAASAPVTIEDYERSIALLDEYLELVDDIVMRNKRSELALQLDTLKDIESITEGALELYDNSQYSEAFAILSDGMAKYPDENAVSETYELIRQSYIDDITEKVTSLCDEKQYDEALAIIDEAITICNCREFTDLRELVREESSILYRIKKGFYRHFGRFF